jgi:hypothetical protein
VLERCIAYTVNTTGKLWSAQGHAPFGFGFQLEAEVGWVNRPVKFTAIRPERLLSGKQAYI